MIQLLRPRATAGMTVIVDSVPILIADATISEGHRRSAKLTSHPR